MKYLAIFVLFSLTACVTPYQQRGATGGLTEIQLDKDIFQIEFIGNAYTTTDIANDYTLLRSAEVTLENGFNYFSMVEVATSSAAIHIGFMGSAGRPIVSRTIQCFKKKPKSFSYNAEAIMKSLKKKHNIL